MEYACKPSGVSRFGMMMEGPAIIGSNLKKVEKEAVAAAIVAVCLEDDEWRAVTAQEWGKELDKNYVYKVFPQNVINSLWAMAEEGLLIIDEKSDPQTITPTSALVNLIR